MLNKKVNPTETDQSWRKMAAAMEHATGIDYHSLTSTYDALREHLGKFFVQ